MPLPAAVVAVQTLARTTQAVVLASTHAKKTGGSGVAQARLTAARQVVLQSAGAVGHDIAAFFSMDV